MGRKWVKRVAGVLSCAVAPVCAQAAAWTWNGSTNVNWSTPANWNGGTVPASAVSTHLTFGNAFVLSPTNDIAGTFKLNELTFNSTSATAYDLRGNPLDFRTDAVPPKLSSLQPANALVENNLVLTNDLGVDVFYDTSSLTLSGAISGSGGISKDFQGTLVLSGTANSFQGSVFVGGGVLSLTNALAIPGGRTVTVSDAGTLRLDYTSGNNAAAPIGTLHLSSGLLRVPAGSADFYLNKINSVAASIDCSGASSFWLHLTGTGANVNVSDNATWTGGGSSKIWNENSGMIDFTIAGGKTLSTSLPLAAGAGGQGFRLAGGGTLRPTASGTSAPITVDASFYQFSDPSHVTSGALTLQNAGLLIYDGVSAASLFKQINLGSGGGQIGSYNALLSLGPINEQVSGSPVFIVGGGGVSLSPFNLYSGRTDIYSGGIASAGSIANGGQNSPLGSSSAAAGNLKISDGTLQYFGPTASTDRGFTVAATSSTIEVSAASTNLTFTGPVAGLNFGVLNKTGPGTLTLSNPSNTSLGTVVKNGTLVVGASGGVLPANAAVIVQTGAELRLGFTSGSNFTAPIGTMELTGGKLTVPAGSADYYVNQLSVSSGGSIDFTGASAFWLHMTGSGSRIDVAGNSTWTGPGTSRLQNDTNAMIDLALTSGTTLTNSIPLVAGVNGQGFKIADPLGSAVTLVQTGTGGSAPITLDRAAYQFGDTAFVTTGALTLQNGSTLKYTGTTPATLNRNITLAPGSNNFAFLLTSTSELTVSGIISESSPGPVLELFQSIVTLSGNNTYTGKTAVAFSTLSVPSIPNGGVAGPLGMSSSAPGNLLLSASTLRYTGVSASTDRGINLDNTTLDVTAAATNLSISGQLTGSGLTKTGPGTLTLTGTTNTYIGGTTINAGVLAVGAAGAVIPSGSNVTVNAGAKLQLGTSTNNPSSPIGQVALNGGTLRVPAGDSDYYLNQLTSSAGGAIDFSGSTNFWLHFTGSGAGITINNDATWTGAFGNGGSSLIRNDTGGMIDLTFSNFQSLHNGIPLVAGGNGQGFRVVKGNLFQDVSGSTAPITVDGVGVGSAYHIPDVSFVTSGSLILRSQGVLQYAGAPAATLAKDFSIDGAGGLRATGGGTLTVAGIISESSAGSSLAIGSTGESFVLTGVNTYAGPTYIPESTVSVSTLPNGGVAGPLGKSSAAPANLEIDGGVLRYTGATATTDRGFTVTESLAAIDVTTAATNLTFTGPVAGIGALTKKGAGTLTLTNANLCYADKTNVHEGKLALATNLTSSSSIYASGTLELSTGGGSNRVIKTQSVATGNSTGKIDLKDNKLILTAQPVGSWDGGAYSGVTQLIQSGRNGGAWDGDGILTSMTAATGGNTLTSLAVASNADLGYATFGGVSVGATDTLVMYTYAGDANLDGVINGDDYFQIDSAFPQLLHGWMNGDFDYDGTINGDDYFLIDSNFSAQGPAFPTSAGLSDSVTMVPEPALALTAVAVIIFAPQRRRRGRGPG